MTLLLDTCSFLWWTTGKEGRGGISRRALELIRDDTNRVFLSTASCWEIALKHAIGKLPIRGPVESVVPKWIARYAVEPLPILVTHALGTASLPFHHGDPFDRMLIAQAQIENLTVVTPDPIFRRYHVETFW